MILDNENSNKKVYEWIYDYTNSGVFDIVTGYFTVGALAYISSCTNDKINKYRFVLGDIVNTDELKERAIDLLNENISIEASLKLKKVAKEAVTFLQQSKVIAKTLEPNFCHAKAYIFDDNKDDRHKYYISGSSNLTEAGIGLKHTNNIELNIADTGNDGQYNELREWFEDLWSKPQAHTQKTLTDKNGKKYKKDFKEYLIEEIQKIFIEYTPKELYYKVLFELFGEELLKEQDNPEFSRDLGRLENSIIYNSLYSFQQKGVLSLIKMLQKYNGAILADAVGLGKTWSALAVIKYFQQKGYENILLCPKKLENNWQQYLKRRGSKFEADQFDFIVRFHTDLFENRLEKDGLSIKEYFQSDKPKLIIIDESHNLRNAKSNRYKFLVDTLLKQNDNIKVLLLSATPINNTLNDIKNQFKLMVKDNDHGFSESLDVRSIDGVFRSAQRKFVEWSESNDNHISKFIESLPSNFFRLTDSLTVARTRKMIEDDEMQLSFPKKHSPENIYVTPSAIGDFYTFGELLNSLPPKLTAYKPAMYITNSSDDVLNDEGQRDRALVRMMYILLLKRLESSWKSFYDTVNKINDYHQLVYDKALEYQQTKNSDGISQDIFSLFDDEDIDELTIGKREIKLSDIDSSGELDNFIDDLNNDLISLKKLISNLQKFDDTVSHECSLDKEHTSTDTKLQKLIEILKNKQTQSNPKVIIFSAYTDTSKYIYKQLLCRGFKKVALVTGDYSQTCDKPNEKTKKYEPILQRFAPYTKLYLEKEWKKFDGNSFKEWYQWIKSNDSDTLELLDNQIDILITTDVLSEGQNLQDADMVINYDIHWNPVRVIQRMGRIDRIGSPNKEIYGVNFWPSKDINDYLDLQNRIEQRMATMKIVGSEIDHTFTDGLQQISEDDNLEQKQKAKMMQQMQTTWDDIEVSDKSLGFNDLSLEEFRQDLFNELQKDNEYYKNMPKGVFTGFKADNELNLDSGLIALLGYPAKPPKKKDYTYKHHELIYIDEEGKPILLNQKEVLDFLTHHKEYDRFVPKDIDLGVDESIDKLHNSLKSWVESLSSKDVENSDGTTSKKAGEKTLDVLNKLKFGGKKTVDTIKQSTTIEKEYGEENFDLIVWFTVSED